MATLRTPSRDVNSSIRMANILFMRHGASK